MDSAARVKRVERSQNESQYTFTYKILFIARLLLLISSITISIILGPVTISPLTVWKIVLSKIEVFENHIVSSWSKAQEQTIG
jgi:iron complex transport system permease protein